MNWSTLRKAAAASVKTRNAAIREYIAAGFGVEFITRATGLTAAQVRRVERG